MRLQKSESRAVTLSDVARAAGVSKATAGFACAGNGLIAAQTREQVLQVARELGYEPNPHARRLAIGRCRNTIALFCLNMDLGVSTRKLQQIQMLLDERGYSVMLHARGFYGDKHGDEVQPQIELLASMRRQKPMAMVCHTAHLGSGALDELKRFQDEGGILVCYSYGAPARLECDQVVFDDRDNVRRVTRHLLELGHRDVGLFTPATQPWGAYVEGLSDALSEYGLQVRSEWILSGTYHPQLEREGAYAAEQFLRLKDRPTAMCIVNDHAALAFITRLKAAGVDVPDEVSVAGFDDAPLAAHCLPALTTVRHPVEEIAAAVVSLLDSRLRGEYNGEPRVVTLGGEVVVRQSTATPVAPVVAPKKC